MRKTLALFGMLSVLGTSALLIVPRAHAAEDPPAAGATEAKDADALLAEFMSAKPAPFDPARKDDMEYRQQYQQQRLEAMEKQAQIAKDFYDRFPTHAEAGKLMQTRWQILSMQRQGDQVTQETQDAIDKHPTAPVASAARFARAMVAMNSPKPFEEKLGAVEDFIEADPKDPRGGELLVQLASHDMDDAAKQTELLKRVQTQYPDSRAAKSAAGQLRQVDGVGKPFELSFTEAISGKPISMSDLKGKVVVVDYWATWCGPCVAEMPKMKSLYEQYKPQGVEFIGISLDAPEDQGGLDKLKKFVAENDIKWPQYYQGNGWQSEFSSSWGINSIPAVWVIDADGKLHSTSGRGQLEQMIPELIAKRDGK